MGATFAKVKPPKGRAVTYPVTIGEDGSQRIVVESGTYVAKSRDGSGLVHTVSTGCQDEGAARSVLNELARERFANNLDFVTKVELRGRERQLTVKTLVATGLRKGDRASARLWHLDLDAEH